jgi:hypothetical protein
MEVKQTAMVLSIKKTPAGSVIKSDLANMEKRIETLKRSEATPNCHLVENPSKLGLRVRERGICVLPPSKQRLNLNNDEL